ncbi:MAG: RluA family pseudouridine synthase [Gammaproteobacteria bacterium]|nr:RluA family pseudouridine synthase [Gammaproteobacteria bacterium]
MNSKTLHLTEIIPGERLDKFLSSQIRDFSRVEIQAAIHAGKVQINAQSVSPKTKLKVGDAVSVHLVRHEIGVDQAESIPLRIVYEDEAVIVINKPPGLTVHPGAGQKTGTLVNALLFHRPLQNTLPRAGIVHRLDKNTAGLMVVAKMGEARLNLISQLKEHSVERIYVALVRGHLISGKTINAPIGRHPVDRVRMAVLMHSLHAKPAVTHVKVLKHFVGYTLIEAQLETGRTHQIRVHLAHLGYPLVGDTVYGKRGNQSALFPRQALQAERLSFKHPLSNEIMHFSVPWEQDFVDLIQNLEA